MKPLEEGNGPMKLTPVPTPGKVQEHAERWGFEADVT